DPVPIVRLGRATASRVVRASPRTPAVRHHGRACAGADRVPPAGPRGPLRRRRGDRVPWPACTVRGGGERPPIVRIAGAGGARPRQVAVADDGGPGRGAARDRRRLLEGE